MFAIAPSGMCPRCGGPTHRTRTPLWLRPLRMLFRHTVTRRCGAKRCRWRGLAVHESMGRGRTAGAS